MPISDSRSAACRILVGATALAVVLAAVSLPVLDAAEAPPGPLEAPKLIEAARRGWLRAGIVSGRVRFGATRLGNMNDTAKAGGREERLSISIGVQQFTASYELSTSDQRLLVEIAGRDRLHVRRTPQGDAGWEPADFRQAPDEPLRVTLGPEAAGQVDERAVYEAPSLWHLLVMEPDVGRKHVVPLLEVLDPQWDLDRTAAQVESVLVRAAAEGDLPDPNRWAALVEQLGDARFARREAADRELRSLGRVVYTYLRQLDASRLDAEQHYRVRRIVMALAARMDDDTPPEIATWLAGDPAIWLALLARDDETTRRLAAARLETLLGGPIRFDPAADGKTRQKQLEPLRARVRNRPEGPGRE